MSSADAQNTLQMAQAANQANQTYNDVSAKIPQGTKDFLSSAKNKVLDNDNLRSFSVFLGTGEESAYQVVCNPTVLCGRLKDNILFFYLNYILVAALVTIIALLALMINPATIIMVLIIGVCWSAALTLTSGEGLVLCNDSLTITRKTATTILTIITAVVMFFMVQKVFVITSSSSAVLACFHGMLRNATEHIEGNKNAGESNYTDVNIIEEGGEYKAPVT
eukprot:CAMPEP_0198252182 /NCGR_PEP_ID=MMETSP1447-20131203/2744_1 /TAXON_ID=420782 /ORGANISM="Chaetoceros dichaeta, Strain CCMP1751" /LENGTH=220 /DNA_ID=CAMNT_0043937351 /DNA_START=122 /DNA_END=784 /DNA_ORIENTATION=+